MKPWLVMCASLMSTVNGFAEPLTFESSETRANLLELFTSEGCSSCPPADAWVGKLKSSPDLWKNIVPVVFHVDYWDGLGWPDRFANSANTARQRRYAAAWRSESVYTPGFVLQGREWRGWRGDYALPATSGEKTGKLRVTLRDKTHVEVTFSPSGHTPKSLQVELALLGGELESNVKRGENRGRKLRHDFAVLHLASAAMTTVNGEFIASIILPSATVEPPNAVAAWVVAGVSQPPIQATGGWLKTEH